MAAKKKAKKKVAGKSVTAADLKKRSSKSLMAKATPQEKLDRKWEKYERKTLKQIDKTIKKNTKDLKRLGAG